MASSSSSLFDDLAEGIHKFKFKYVLGNKKCEKVELNIKIVIAILNKQTLKDDLIVYECLCCNRNYQKNV